MMIANTPAGWSEHARTTQTSWDACGWSYKGQRDRLARVTLELDPKVGETLLDYGCGTGALTDYLTALDPDGYTGYDWADDMVERAAREHPGFRFQTWEPTGMFDLVACVGTFNLRGSKQETWHTLRRLWDSTKRMLVASLYCGYDRECLSYTVQETMTFARQLGFYARAERWRGNDILLVAHR